ncbi:DEAD-box ATP-dependent RNA helicase family protein, partial [Trifolium pratense]
MPTKIFLSQLRLLHFQPMKLHSPQFLSQTLFKFSHLPLQNAAFRPFSVKPDRIRVSKSLVDDEAELSNWVDDLRTGRAETMKPAQRVSSGRETGDREGGFRPRKSSVSRGSGSNFVK